MFVNASPSLEARAGVLPPALLGSRTATRSRAPCVGVKDGEAYEVVFVVSESEVRELTVAITSSPPKEALGRG